MITNNIRDLAEGHGVYAFVLTPQGKIQGDLYAYNRGESLFLDFDQSQLPRLIDLLKRYIIMDKVEFAEEPLSAVGIAGPGAPERLTDTLEIQEVKALKPLQLIRTTWKNVDITVVRGDNPATPSFEIWADAETIRLLRETLILDGAQPVSAETLELLRIASGIPRYGQDIHDRDLPQETGQTRALNFTKGCYIGQEIVERIRARGNVHRAFTGFTVNGELPASGEKIQAEGKDVGEITSAAWLPTSSGRVAAALGYLRREASDKSLSAGSSNLKVSDLPFPQIFDSSNETIERKQHG
jgi:aminomethyltransferase